VLWLSRFTYQTLQWSQHSFSVFPPCKVENIVQSLALSLKLYDYSDYLGSTAVEKPTYKMQVVSLVAFVGNHNCSLVWQSAARNAARVRLERGLDPYRTCAGAGRTTWSCVTSSVSQRGWPPSSVAAFVGISHVHFATSCICCPSALFRRSKPCHDNLAVKTLARCCLLSTTNSLQATASLLGKYPWVRKRNGQQRRSGVLAFCQSTSCFSFACTATDKHPSSPTPA